MKIRRAKSEGRNGRMRELRKPGQSVAGKFAALSVSTLGLVA